MPQFTSSTGYFTPTLRGPRVWGLSLREWQDEHVLGVRVAAGSARANVGT